MDVGVPAPERPTDCKFLLESKIAIEHRIFFGNAVVKDLGSRRAVDGSDCVFCLIPCVH